MLYKWGCRCNNKTAMTCSMYEQYNGLATNSHELFTTISGGKVFVRPGTAGKFKEAVLRLILFLTKTLGLGCKLAFFGA